MSDTEDKYSTWIADQIAAHSPDKTDDHEAAFILAKACAAFGGGGSTAFGLELPATYQASDELKQRAVETLKRWLPQLSDEERERLKKMIAEYRLVGVH
jgi:hypothetical protein